MLGSASFQIASSFWQTDAAQQVGEATGVLGLIDDPQAPATQFADDAVVRDGLTDQRGGLRRSTHILGAL